jgi:redox-sensitive bicupin YhaK (pirin superfamily)
MRIDMKKILEIHKSPAQHWVGDGFPVRSILSSQRLGQAISPFLLLDYGGPVKFPPTNQALGVDEHPHRGFETVTIVYQGELEHRDSTGNHGNIGPGDVQWMTAASGIVHEEKHAHEFARRGGMFEMAQLWVNLPAKFKMLPPGYQTLRNRDIPVVKLAKESGTMRVIAGNYQGVKGPARTFTPINLWDMQLKAGWRTELNLPDGYTTVLVSLRGKSVLNGAEKVGEAELAWFDRKGENINIEAMEDAAILVLNGEPIGEPVFSYGPFVMNTQEEIRQAILDYQSGRMGRISHQN